MSDHNYLNSVCGPHKYMCSYLYVLLMPFIIDGYFNVYFSNIINVFMQETSVMRPFDLVVPAPTGLAAGALYKYRLLVTNSAGRSSYGDVVVRINAPPTGGSIMVTGNCSSGCGIVNITK